VLLASEKVKTVLPFAILPSLQETHFISFFWF
jgi:hypothetical protein